MAIPKAEPGKTRIGWIGTGVMGRWMCQHLMTKGYKATVYNRSKDKAQPLLDAGRRLGRHAPASGREVGRGLRHRRLSQGCARGLSGRPGRSGRQQAGCDAGRHDHQRAVAGPRNLRCRQGQGRPKRRCAGVRRRRRRQERHAIDHGRRRRGRCRGRQAVP